MTRHYIRMSLRILKKQRLFAVINVVGLSLALAIVLLISLFVRDEFTFDTWHQRADQIFSVETVNLNPDGSPRSQSAYHPYPLAEALIQDHPGIEQTVRMLDNSVVVRVDGRASEQRVLFADSTFLQVFDYDVLRGDLTRALHDPAAAVLTETAALRQFGDIDVVGRSFEIRFEDSYEPAVVSAVVADLPSNTNIRFAYLLPFHRAPMVYEWVADRMDRWNASSFNVFAVLKDNVTQAAAEATIRELWAHYNAGRIETLRERGSWEGQGSPAVFTLVPLRSLHIGAGALGGGSRPTVRAATGTYGVLAPPSDPMYSWILITIAIAILALACINFVILSIGRSTTRAAEIGVRKALGAQRRQLVTQFGSESIVLALVAFVVSIGLATLLLPIFNGLSGKFLSIEVLRDAPLLTLLLCFAVLAGLVAGWYPSLVILRHRPAEVLRGRFRPGGPNRITRSLIVAQFAASVALVAVALVMLQQMRHIQRLDLGYDAESVIVVHANRTDGSELTRHLERTIGAHVGVEEIGAVSFSINRGSSHEGWRFGEREYAAYVYNVEPEAVRALGVDLLAGETHNERFVSDSTFAVLINPSLAELLGYTPDEAIGQQVMGYDDPAPYIVGVVDNIHYRSLHHEVGPMMMTMDPREHMRYALVRVRGTRHVGSIIEALGAAWQSYAPDVPLSYSFLDDDVALTYENDRRWSRVVRYAAGLAVLIACMGLFGLAALTIVRRTKEIGIRKVLGASIPSILLLVTIDFARMVVVATVVAAPVAVLSLSKWLQGFAYHVPLQLWVFGIAGLLVLLLALGTVSYHALRVSIANPVDALRYE